MKPDLPTAPAFEPRSASSGTPLIRPGTTALQRLSFAILIAFLFMIFSQIFDIQLTSLHLPGITYRVVGLFLLVSGTFIVAFRDRIGKCALGFTFCFAAAGVFSIWRRGSEIGTLAATLGIDGAEVMDAFCRDTVLNISRAYLNPGFAFGGSCLPKDLRALVYRASRLDLKLPLLESVLPSNEQHLDRSLQAIMDLPARRLGVFGLAFKENTDDLRESPVVILLERLIGKGRDVRVFDPHIVPDRIYGSNERYLLAAIPHIGKLSTPSLQEMLAWADHVVITQKPSPECAALIASAALPVTDLVTTIPAPQPVAEPAAGA